MALVDVNKLTRLHSVSVVVCLSERFRWSGDLLLQNFPENDGLALNFAFVYARHDDGLSLFSFWW